MKIFRVCSVLGIIAILLFVFAVPVLATAISQPDNPPTISNTHVNRYLVASGDVLITGLYNIPYATLPTTVDTSWTADKAFIIRLIDTDNVTELGTITPYAYFVSGYRQGVFSFYFPASANMASVGNWGKAYTIRISENPALFATPLSWDTAIPSSAYTTLTAQTDNQGDLADRVASFAQTLQGLYPTYTLLSSSGGRTVLTTTSGENYFRGAIYGLQAMAPSLYLVQGLPIDYTATTWATTQFDTYAARFNGTWVGTAQTATATQFGLPVQLVTSIPILLLCLGFIVLSSLLVKKIEPAWIISCLLVMMGGLLGWVSMAIVAIIYQLMAIYLSWIYFGSKQMWVQFIAVVWFASTLICLILEGSYFTTSHNTVVSDLAVITTLNVGNLLGLPAVALTFFRGIVRMFLFDYSFYSGGYVILRYFFVLVFGSGITYDIFKGLAYMTAQFIPRL